MHVIRWTAAINLSIRSVLKTILTKEGSFISQYVFLSTGVKNVQIRECTCTYCDSGVKYSDIQNGEFEPNKKFSSSRIFTYDWVELDCRRSVSTSSVDGFATR